MTKRRAQLVIAAVFGISLIAQLAIVVVLGNQDKMWDNEQLSLITKLLTIYSVPLGVIFFGMVASARSRSAGKRQPLGLIALAFVLVWNILFVARCLRLALAPHDSVSSALSYYEAISSNGSWLIAGVLTLFFAARDTAEKPTA
jgi:hypothetical protein